MYKFLLRIVSVLIKIIYRVRVNGIENLKDDKPFIMSANHVHIFDPVILATLTKKQIFFLAKKELFSKKFLAKFFTKLGVIGTRVKTIDIKNMKKGVALIALKNKVNILPIHIQGTYKIFSKITVDIYPMIEINNFENMEDSEAIDKLTEELFYKIYQGKYGNLYSK